MSFANNSYDIFRIAFDSLIKEIQSDSVHSIIAIADSCGKILYVRGASEPKDPFPSVMKFLDKSCYEQYLYNVSLGVPGIYYGSNSDKEIVTVQYKKGGFLECGILDFSGQGYCNLQKYRQRLESDSKYLQDFRQRNRILLSAMLFSDNFNKRLETVIGLHDFLVMRQNCPESNDQNNCFVIELCNFIKTLKRYAAGISDVFIKTRNFKTTFAKVPRDYVQAVIYQTAMFIKFSKSRQLAISVRTIENTVELEMSCTVCKNSFSEMHFSTVSDILSTFPFRTEFTSSKDLLIAKAQLPLPEDTSSILSDYIESDIYTKEILSLASTENIFRFICEG